ncbi:glycosyltransferase family 2 protein [Halobacillus hunanensis]|uniref:glycosyltransferase family 2 protein n=1 Tax=Halobacillus hunanensis TaxID=578214 RepID=UPI0015913EC8|nr:glycosyltransferase family 2 protein [Halobacillus hunanensis]
MTKISVIIPVFNVEDYLDSCLESIMGQSYPVFEVLLINDGSTDKSGQILQHWEQKFDKIKVIHQPNSGAPGNPRNKGISYASGDYLSFIDPDDYIENEYYETLVKDIERDHPDIAISKILKFNTKRTWMPPTFDKLNLFKDNRTTTLFKETNLIHNLGPSNKLYRTSFIKKHNIKFLEGYSYEDVHFTSCCMYLAEAITINNNTTYYWRRRESEKNKSITQQKNQYKSVLDRLFVHKEIDLFLTENGLIDFRYIKDMRAILDFTRHANQLYEFTQKDQKEFFKEIKSYLETIDPKAYNILPPYAKNYYLQRLFFLYEGLHYELVASSTDKYGYLPSKIDNGKIHFDFSYLNQYKNHKLFKTQIGVPGTLSKAYAITDKAAVTDDKLLIQGYGYINYVNVTNRDQISIHLIVKDRNTKEEITFDTMVSESSELNKNDISRKFCKFNAKINLEELNISQRHTKLDFTLQIKIDGHSKTKRLVLPDNATIGNANQNFSFYKTKYNNLSLKNNS